MYLLGRRIKDGPKSLTFLAPFGETLGVFFYRRPVVSSSQHSDRHWSGTRIHATYPSV